MVYGSGPNGTRGVTYFKRWQNGHPEPVPFVEICAGCEESWVQLAGTTIHELAHVIAGFEAGHGPAWKEACRKLGLRHCPAAGTEYRLANFGGRLRMAHRQPRTPDEGPDVTRGVPVGPRPNTHARRLGARHP